jgi:diaminohydroxyphosphoribosylaminopyrimidine deaminase / 5-amino-6-(5-phosphoribosylamino)uracil reductase
VSGSDLGASEESGPVALGAVDAAHLERARRIARAGWGQVEPNPVVGCVLVRDGEIVGEGHHEVFGGPHAEIVALERALGTAEGATAYVSLEPCSHRGKTPPCSRALIDAGVSRVVYGAVDPGQESGGGAVELRGAGLEVIGPAWDTQRARAENPFFYHAARHDPPFVALKLAMSLDAKIASAPGVRTRITGPEAEHEVHRLRSGFDAVMVGAGTLRADNPRLTVRLGPAGREPTRRIVLVPDGVIPAGSHLFDDVDSAPVHIFCRADVSEEDLERTEAAGGHVHPVASGAGGLDLTAVLEVCREVGIRSILCEGGHTLADRLLREDHVGRLYLFVAPVTLGSGGVPAFPDDAAALDWSRYAPAQAPAPFGRDALVVLDRQEAF